MEIKLNSNKVVDCYSCNKTENRGDKPGKNKYHHIQITKATFMVLCTHCLLKLDQKLHSYIESNL